MEEILRAGFTELGVAADEAAIRNLRRYYERLEEKNAVMNLTAIHGETDTARLHFLDCGAVLRYVSPERKTLLDVGSGAGFPGLVLKILRPDTAVTLLDSLRKRTAFLRETADALGLDAACIAGRAEEMTELRESFDIVTSRAVARLNTLCELCLPLVKVGGVFAAMKGPEPEEELSEAARAIRMLGGGEARIEKYAVPGTETVHSLILISKLAPAPAKYPRRYAVMKKNPL